MLELTVYGMDALDGDPENEVKPLILEAVNYVSLFNAGTHGPPALVAPGRADGRPQPGIARPGQRVAYINTALIPLFEIERQGGDD